VFRQAANVLSIIRIPASLGVLATYDPHSPLRLWIGTGLILIIMGSDFFDGKIARRYHVASKFGYVLDGLGDRACHVAAYLLLFMTGVLDVLVVWTLIFREISQYAVRLIETDWHTTQSSIDRSVAKTYTTVVQGALLLEFLRHLLLPEADASPIYIVAVNVTLFGAVIGSYTRIGPHLWRAWQDATHA
jgi:CDP-diacylglycerol---glycerol-3-phosphate 3-phosphatidyltransferase